MVTGMSHEDGLVNNDDNDVMMVIVKLLIKMVIIYTGESDDVTMLIL